MTIHVNFINKLPYVYDQFKCYVEERNQGDTVGLYRIKVNPEINATIFDDVVLSLLNNNFLKEEICKKEKERSKFWCKEVPQNHTRENTNLVFYDVFQFLGSLCRLATKQVIDNEAIDLSPRVDVAISLFKEITEERYGDFMGTKIGKGWLNFHTHPMCATMFIGDFLNQEIWILFWNNWNF